MIDHIDTGLVAVLGLVITLLIHAVIISRWSARLDTVVKQLQEEMREFRNILSRHDQAIEALKIATEVERQVRMQVDRAIKNGGV